MLGAVFRVIAYMTNFKLPLVSKEWREATARRVQAQDGPATANEVLGNVPRPVAHRSVLKPPTAAAAESPSSPTGPTRAPPRKRAKTRRAQVQHHHQIESSDEDEDEAALLDASGVRAAPAVVSLQPAASQPKRTATIPVPVSGPTQPSQRSTRSKAPKRAAARHVLSSDDSDSEPEALEQASFAERRRQAQSWDEDSWDEDW
jgi:hypothetical protein